MEIVKFAFENNELRVIFEEDEPLFVAADLAKILGYRDAGHLTRMLDDDEVKGYKKVGTLGGDQQMSTITESGVYHAVFKSQRLEAKAVRRWVTSEVLPSIRKTGGYISEHATHEQLETLQAEVARLTALREERDEKFVADRLFELGNRSGSKSWVEDYAKAEIKKERATVNARAHEVRYNLACFVVEGAEQALHNSLARCPASARPTLTQILNELQHLKNKQEQIWHNYTHGWGTCIPKTLHDFKTY